MAKTSNGATAKAEVTSASNSAAASPLDAYLSELVNRQDQLVEAFGEVTANESGGTGLEAGLAAANRLAFPTDVLLDWNPKDKDSPVYTGLARAIDLADPFVSADWRKAMSEALGMAVNAMEDAQATDARYGDNGTEGTGKLDKPEFAKVPKLSRDKDTGPADYLKRLEDKVASTSNDPKLSALYQAALDAATNGDVDAVRRMARSLNKVQVTASKRSNMVYLPIIIGQLRDYDDEVAGTAAPTAGTIWNEADAKARAGHRAAYNGKDGKEELKPSRAEVEAAIAEEVKLFLYGDGNGNAGKAQLAEGKAKPTTEEQLTRAHANLYAAARKIDDLTGSKDDIHNKVITILRHLVPDTVQDKEDAAKEAERQAQIAAVAEAERLKEERKQAKADAAAKATTATKATGADVTRAQAEVAAAKQTAAAKAPTQGRAKPAVTGKPTVTTAQAATAELDALEVATTAKPASVPTVKAPAGKRK